MRVRGKLPFKTEANKYLYFSVFVISITLILVFFPIKYNQGDLMRDIDLSIDKGIDFLFNDQLDYGEFKTLGCENKKMDNCFLDSSPFATTFVLYSLKDINDDRIKIMKSKALDFLKSEEEPGGIWRYTTSRNNYNKKEDIPPDAGDISSVSFILNLNGIEIDDNRDLLLNNRNNDNLFLLWIYDGKKYNMSDHMVFNSEDGKNPNLVGCGVNANVAMYINNSDVSKPVCKFINHQIANNGCKSQFYDKKFFLYYVISRAYSNGIDCLNDIKSKIINNILDSQNEDGSFGTDMDTALSLNALFMLKYRGPEIFKGVNSLLNNQNEDGSWDIDILARSKSDVVEEYYFSQDIVTAWAIEALHRFETK